MAMKTEIYERSLTYGQCNSIKSLMRLLKRFSLSKDLIDIAMNLKEHGTPGYSSRYRVRVRYK